MALTVSGGVGTFNADKWAKWSRIADAGNWKECVAGAADFAPSIGTGTRKVLIDPGDVIFPGGMVESDSQVTLTLDTQSGSNSRIDYVVLEVVWSGSSCNATFQVLKGTPANNPAPPSGLLVRNGGVKWHVPLARVTVAPSAIQLPNSALEGCVPQPRRPIRYTDVIADVTVAATADPRQVCAIQIPDPGWPYRVQMMGAANMQALTGSGHGNVYGYIDSGAGPVLVTSGAAAQKNASPAILRPDVTGLISEAKSVATFTISPVNMSGEQLVTQQQHSGFTVLVLPA